MLLLRDELQALEQSLTLAFRASISSPANERVAFVAQHLIKQAVGKARAPPPVPVQRSPAETRMIVAEMNVVGQEIARALNATVAKAADGHALHGGSLLRMVAAALMHRSSRRGSGARPVTKTWLNWGDSFVDTDPRQQIREFFRPGDERGPAGLLRSLRAIPSGRCVSTYFTVWRPTSLDAIRMMMAGRATGKGLNVKGKSAKTGALSGFVPFLQISDERHKRRICVSPPSASTRVFYPSEAARSSARSALQCVLDEMLAAVSAARAALDDEETAAVSLADDAKRRQ